MPKPNPRGQSATEFVLIAPLLFLIFFSVIQFAYMAYVSLAVQRSALAIARKASLQTPEDNSNAFKSQLALSLLPIANLNSKTLLTILETHYDISYSPDRQKVTATVHYPMPIWVPMVRTIFGDTLVPSTNYQNTPEGLAIRTAFSLFNIPQPDLSFEGVRLPVHWVTFQEATFNEGEPTGK
jgi:Flp pilus assembly protein TadG